MSRIMFAFILIALFFAVCSLFLGLFALCSRIGSYLSSVLCALALLVQTVAAALMTYVWPFSLSPHSSVPLQNPYSSSLAPV